MCIRDSAGSGHRARRALWKLPAHPGQPGPGAVSGRDRSLVGAPDGTSRRTRAGDGMRLVVMLLTATAVLAWPCGPRVSCVARGYDAVGDEAAGSRTSACLLYTSPSPR